MMIQNIAPDILDNHYTEQSPNADSPMLVYQNDKILIRFNPETSRTEFPSWKEFSGKKSAIYLFSVSGKPYFLLYESSDLPTGYEWYTMKDMQQLPRTGNTEPFLAFTGWHLWKWYQNSKFCGACGAETVFDHTERAKVCPVCRNHIYPRINPAVIVGITNGERILLTKYKTGYAYHALVAGFTEIGECKA